MAKGPARRSLGPQELALVEAWEADRTRVITLDGIQEALGRQTRRGTARMVALRLRNKGFLSSLGRGVYAVLPVNTLGIEAPDVAVYLNALLLRRIRFYIGFDTAAGHYGWYPEAYGRVTIGVPQTARNTLTPLGGTYVRVVRCASTVFVDGVSTETWRGIRIPMSTREQTLLDIVRKAGLVDGFSGCLGVLRAAANARGLDHTRLAQMAAGRTSVRQRKRLGWLSERAGWTWTPEEIDLLRHDWPPSHRATLGDSHSRAAGGSWDSRWGLLVNVPERELVPAGGVR